MNENRISLVELKKVVLSRFFDGNSCAGVLFFLPAGTFVYWQAWVYWCCSLVLCFQSCVICLRMTPSCWRADEIKE